ncbi:biotin carboxylase [bacterium]|nr:biotin carboxylase [bacterium]
MAVDLQSPLQGTVLIIDVEVGDQILEGQRVALLESMKMEHEVLATSGGVITKVCIEIGQMVSESENLFSFDERETLSENEVTSDELDLTHIRPDLAETIERHEIGRDHRRMSAVEKRYLKGKRTARENIADLTDGGEFIEYGPLVIAPQRKRRSVDDLILNTPADGMVGGLAEVNSDLFDESKTQCVVISYDYTVLAGTQGGQNHRKKDRLFEIAKKWKLPVVFFTEGGGGRPGDTDGLQVAGLDCLAFGLWAELSGDVPLVGITSGYCFAGNAAILGCCDVIIATEDANIGMGGPSMIEGGGLGTYHPSEIGPMETQKANGVVDILAKDEQEAVKIAKKYLSYFQGEGTDWDLQDQRALRHLIPENRLRAYDIRKVINVLFDIDSVLELRKDFGFGIITSLARIEGKPIGVIANNPEHLGGAIDADAADKASRFMQLCDAHDLPIISLCDTPGFMVGPEAEESGLVRHVSRMFVNARSVTVPTGTIVLRKAYGLGAQAMASGGFKFPMFTISWPTGEFGGMGLEGAVKLGYKKDLEAIDDPKEREHMYQNLVKRMYEVGKGLSMADHFEIDDVIDPQESRKWIITALRAAGPAKSRGEKKRPMIDTW